MSQTPLPESSRKPTQFRAWPTKQLYGEIFAPRALRELPTSQFVLRALSYCSLISESIG